MKYALTQEDRAVLAGEIVDGVRAMPSLMQRSFRLGHYQGLSPQQISTRLGLNRRDVLTLLNCGRTRLHKRLSSFRRHRAAGLAVSGDCVCC